MGTLTDEFGTPLYDPDTGEAYGLPDDLTIDPESGRLAVWRKARPLADNDNLPPIVALTGRAGAGKSTAADYLVRHYGYVRTKFAGPLKDMLRAIGLGDREIEGDGKEVRTHRLAGHAPRRAMQTLGAEWGRKCMGEDFWVGLWREVARDVLDHGGRVVVDDCRYANEAMAVKDWGGVVLKIVRDDAVIAPPLHESEVQAVPHDMIVRNDSLPRFHARLDAALSFAAAA